MANIVWNVEGSIKGIAGSFVKAVMMEMTLSVVRHVFFVATLFVFGSYDHVHNTNETSPRGQSESSFAALKNRCA